MIDEEIREENRLKNGNNYENENENNVD